MATWHGYLRIDLDPTFAATLDERARVEQLSRAMKRLISETRKDSKEFPPYALGTPRWKLDNTAVILEGNWDATTKTDVVREWATEMSKTQVAVSAAVTITRFASLGKWDESREECARYIEENSRDWNAELGK